MAKRRSNSEGSIYKRPNGKWQAQVSIHGHRVSKTFTNKVDARDWIYQLEGQKGRGLTSEKAQLTVAEYLETWLEQVSMSLRPKTLYQYRGIVKNHLAPSLGQHKLISLTAARIQQLVTEMHNSGKGPRTIQITHAVLRRALASAKRLGLIRENAAVGIQLPRVKRQEMIILSKKDIGKLLSEVAGTWIAPILQLALTTGMRQGEMLGMQWRDVDFATSTISVRRQLQRVPGKGLVLSEPKTITGIRTVQLGRRSLKILMTQWNYLQDVNDKDPEPRDLVFQSSVGTPVEPRNVLRTFKQALDQAGLPKIRFHDLRHTAASLMLASGRPIINVSRQLGHSKPSTTLDIYGHLVPGMEGEGANLQDEMVFSTAAELQQEDVNFLDEGSEKQKVALPRGENTTSAARPEGFEPPAY